MLKSVVRWSEGREEGGMEEGHAARMFNPGAITSGFKISGETGLGPLAEKDATFGAGLTPTLVPLNKMVAVGGDRNCEANEMYLRIWSPPAAPTEVAGRTWQSATRPSPSKGPLAKIMATPPAFFTTRPLAGLELTPLSHTTILPLTDLGSKESSKQREEE
ncbi:hypothetical protein V8G54_007853 [Vigna mungo]|uniref:Uncharacterized protein n=1 Tax=Vigna mungo TaxID=3915 RepID=A0AAQ3P202_VIGMU